MTTLTLYKGVAFDGVNSFPHITNPGEFDSYLSGKQQYSQTINFNRVGEPILINESYDTAIGYSYGRIDTGSKKYYIIPDSVNVNENNRVHLAYSVDWFTTLEYADAISFGRAHLVKSTDVDPLTYAQSISPIDMTISEHIPLQDANAGEIHVAYTTADDRSTVEWILSKVNNGYSKLFTLNNKMWRSIGAHEIMEGVLYRACGIMPDNILGIYYIPFDISDTDSDDSDYITHTKEVGDVNVKRYIWYKLSRFTDAPPFETNYKDYNRTSSAMKSVHLIDRSGSIIYTVPYGRTLKRVSYRPIMSPSECYIAFEFFYDELPSEMNAPSTTKSAENSFLLYMCEKIDYNNDAYANWAMGMKGVEIEERRIQKNKALASGLSNTALTGTIGGTGGTNISMPSKGGLPKIMSSNPAGLAFGVASGLAGPLISYGLDTYYESQINSLEDRKYQLAQDTLVPGSFLHDVYHTLSIVELSASDDDIVRYNNEIANFGADCNLPVSSWSPSVGAYKFTDVEVIADVPYSIKESIKGKMKSGIKIVRIS